MTPLIKLSESDPDLAFSIIDLKRNNGKNRFDRMDLFFIIEVAVNEPQIIRKALQLEKIMNEEMDNLPTYLLRAENQDLVKALASLIGKNDISELNKNEKKLLLISMLNNKGNYDLKYQKVSKCYPTNDLDYSKIINEITQSLNLSLEPLNKDEQAAFDRCLQNLTNSFKTINLENLSELQLSMSHTDFISEVEKIIKDLPMSEQRKYVIITVFI